MAKIIISASATQCGQNYTRSNTRQLQSWPGRILTLLLSEYINMIISYVDAETQ